MPLIVDRENKIIKNLWKQSDVFDPPIKMIAIYNQGNDVYEKYAVIDDDPIKNYIFLASIVKSNKRKQIFLVNRIHIINGGKDDKYYEFKPVIFLNNDKSSDTNIYGSPILPLKCSGPKMMETIKNDRHIFTISNILSNSDLSEILLCGDLKE